MATDATIDGRRRSLRTVPEAPLLYALRGELDLVGARYGCGAGQCGSCRVLVDGIPTSSCTMPLADAADREIDTVAGLVESGRATGVVDALLAVDAGQCGYCLPGIVVTLTSLVERPGPVTRADLLRALDDHLCRCGAHPRILRAATALLGDEHG